MRISLGILGIQQKELRNNDLTACKKVCYANDKPVDRLPATPSRNHIYGKLKAAQQAFGPGHIQRPHYHAKSQLRGQPYSFDITECSYTKESPPSLTLLTGPHKFSCRDLGKITASDRLQSVKWAPRDSAQQTGLKPSVHGAKEDKLVAAVIEYKKSCEEMSKTRFNTEPGAPSVALRKIQETTTVV